jgi:hypothetical protein
MTLSPLRHSLLAVVLAALAMPASATPAASVDRLTDLITHALPMGEVFDQMAAADPAWPAAGAEDKVTVSQLGCLRKELSSAGYRRTVRARVQQYSAANPARIAGDIKVLEDGAAELFRRSMLAGVQQEATGQPVDEAALLADASPAQIEAMTTFFADPGFAPLRLLAGLADDMHAERSVEETEARGEEVGADFATRLMTGAISTCGVQL